MSELDKIKKVLLETTNTDKSYNGQIYDYGYHTLYIDDQELPGQRKPKERLEPVTLDFRKKTVLDLGSNQGGMLFELADRIKHGVGVDFEPKLVNAANKIAYYKKNYNLSFYNFDLSEGNFDRILDLSPVDHFDVVFLLSVCMWIPNWKDLVTWVYENSEYCLFETNGKARDQEAQIEFLQSKYHNVNLLAAQSNDDPKQKKRKLFWCSKKKNII